MRSIAFIFIISVAFAFQTGCGQNPAENANANAEAVKESPFAYITDPTVAMAEGNRLLDDNKTELAIEAFRRAVKLDPDLAEAHFKLGIAYSLIEAEMRDAGVDENSNANSDGAKTAEQKTDSQKEFERAVTAYKKWLVDHPNDVVARFNLGRAYNKLNKDESAEDAFRQAVKLTPNDTDYQTELGAILIKLAKYHEAIPPLKKALELDPENSRAENLLEDAEAGAKRIDFAQVNKDDKKSANSNTNANMSANPSSSGNTVVKPGGLDTKPRKEEPKDKKPERPAAKPKETRH
jgi:Flp pilus assembly protein TadD